MSNLIKSYYVNMNQTEEQPKSRVIDSNGLMEAKLAILKDLFPEASFGGEDSSSDGFVEGLDPEQVAALLGDEAFDENGNPIALEELSPESRALLEEQAGSRVLHEQNRGASNSALEDAKVQVEAMYANANAEIEQMLESARMEAENLRDQILEEARTEGYNNGYTEGLQKARALEQDAKQRGQALIDEGNALKTQYEAFLNDAEPRLVDALIRVFDYVIHANLNEQREELLFLIENTLRQDDSSKAFIVHVSPEAVARVKEEKDRLKANLPETVSVDIIEDMTLAENQCIIDADGSIFDCGLDTQLTELEKKLRILSYDGN